MQSVGTVWLWAVFFIAVISVFCLDLVALKGGRSHRVSTQEALGWTLVWIVCALLFNEFLWLSLLHSSGPVVAGQKSLEFLTGYLLEKTLSIDNMFVILMVFQFFHVQPQYQRRVLLYGVIGAFVLRFIMIFFGVWLVQQFHWILYLFGLFLLITGCKMLVAQDEKRDFQEHKLLRWLKKNLRTTHTFEAEKFFIWKNNLWYATPLFLALIFVEFSDLVFALDSIPAIFGVTSDPFIIFTSNIFAILGLRALYFLLANLAAQFYLLKYGVALILIFIGFKMLFEHWVSISALVSLGVIGGTLAVTMLLSLIKRTR